jgi:hypothetical protein
LGLKRILYFFPFFWCFILELVKIYFAAKGGAPNSFGKSGETELAAQSAAHDLLSKNR